MWAFVIIALIIYLCLIIFSACIYPLLCVGIAVICKRFKELVTTILLLLTIALYLYACITLEHTLDDWCYSVYAGIVLTPALLFLCTGVDDILEWHENVTKPQHDKITIPILAFFTSLLFALEGILRMTDSFSLHMLLNNVLISPESDSYWYYYDGFQYAGGILFWISLISMLFIGLCSFDIYKKSLKELTTNKDKKAAMRSVFNGITQNIKGDFILLISLGAKYLRKIAHYGKPLTSKVVAFFEKTSKNLFLWFSKIKSKKHHEKRNKTENLTVSNIFDMKSANMQEVQMHEDNKPSYKQMSQKSPKTLEECFSDIVSQNGTEILSDKNIANILYSSYEVIDIKEYKEVLDKMFDDRFLYQFINTENQNDFTLYNLTSSYARKNKINIQKSLYITQAMVNAIKMIKH